jgi:hypothetical protein
MLATEYDNPAARALAQDETVSRPFEWALGESIHALAPRIKEHVLQPPGTVVVYRGRMRVWRDGGRRGWFAGWLLRLSMFANFMFPEIGEEVDFEMKHVVTKHDDGSLSMSWIRKFGFSGVTRQFHAMMHFYEQNGPIINWRGCRGLFEVELCPRVEGNEHRDLGTRMADAGPTPHPDSKLADGQAARPRMARSGWRVAHSR